MLLEMDDIYKTFPGVVANDHIDFSVQDGEVHGLLGENGAGKSTLMKILFGLYSADEGSIRCRGEPLSIESPRDANEAGFGMVHQHFKLIPKLTVAENVLLGLRESYPVLHSDPDGAGLTGKLLGSEPVRRLARLLTYDEATQQKRVADVADKYGINIDPERKVHELDVGERQRVEILKALYRDIELLVLDEPTAVLTPDQVNRLFETLRTLVDAGLTVVIITHKLDEVIDITDRITVLREGRKIDTVETDTVDETDLARMMVGREVVHDIDRSSVDLGPPVAFISDLRAEDDRGVEVLSGVDLTVREGEVLGLAGVSGNGQQALVDCIVGLGNQTGGEIMLWGEEVSEAPIKARIDNGLSYVPADRHTDGCAPNLSIRHNSVIKDYRKGRFQSGPGGLGFDHGAASDHARTIVEDYDVRVPNVGTEAGDLSGGNLQKLVLGRELLREPDVLIADQPTRGLDVGAIETVREKILEQRKKGTGVLLISEKLDEILELSDRIAVLYEGEIVHTTDPATTDRETLGLHMSGSSDYSNDSGQQRSVGD
jgi:simple sugar transport system ATP-binding protein